MYIDIAASVLHDGNGHEARLGKEARVALEGIFDSWEVRHTQIDELMADHDFQKCLKAAIKNQIKVTIERKVVPQPQSGSPTLTTDVTLRSLGGAPSPQRPAFDISTPPDDDWVPTFCQAASMGLYQANQLYRSAGGAFKKALRDAIAEGVVIDGSTWAYSGTEVFGVTTTLAIETAAYSLYQTYAILGFWAYQMRSGGCLNVGAQYGWVSPTSSAAGCHYENITLSWGARIPIAPPSVREAKSPNSRPNFEYWTGIVLVCG